MTTINEVAQKVFEREEAEAREAQQRTEATEAAIETLLDQADNLAYYALRLREVLSVIETPLHALCELVHSNAQVSLETAQSLLQDISAVEYQTSDFLAAVDENFGDFDEAEDDGDEDCPCCEADPASVHASIEALVNSLHNLGVRAA